MNMAFGNGEIQDDEKLTEEQMRELMRKMKMKDEKVP